MNDELRDCPFCGGEAVLEMDEVGLHLVRCQACGMETAPEYRPDQALAAWDAMRDGALKPCPFCASSDLYVGEFDGLLEDLAPSDGPWSIYSLEDGDELLDAHNDIILKFPVNIEPKTKRAIAAVPELLDELHVLLEYMPYVPAYQCYKGPDETWDEAIRAHEDVERALALLRRIYGEGGEQNER